jgi:predicted phosphodiesterase
MKFQVFSDLHLELRESYPHIEASCDVLVLAGDIGHIDCELYREFIAYCSTQWKHVIYVLGNHEFYDSVRSYSEMLLIYKRFFLTFRNVYLLDNEVIVLEDIFFYGSTMFTSALPEFLEERIKSFNARMISFDQFMKFENFLQHFKKQNKVVITHFPITRECECIDERYHDQSELRHKYFCNDYLHMFPEILLRKVSCVISGHTHKTYDFVSKYNNVRCIANQYGYPTDSNELHDLYVEM